jgi:hypothetical protein
MYRYVGLFVGNLPYCSFAFCFHEITFIERHRDNARCFVFLKHIISSKRTVRCVPNCPFESLQISFTVKNHSISQKANRIWRNYWVHLTITQLTTGWSPSWSYLLDVCWVPLWTGCLPAYFGNRPRTVRNSFPGLYRQSGSFRLKTNKHSNLMISYGLSSLVLGSR